MSKSDNSTSEHNGVHVRFAFSEKLETEPYLSSGRLMDLETTKLGVKRL